MKLLRKNIEKQFYAEFSQPTFPNYRMIRSALANLDASSISKANAFGLYAKT